jgi:hypothetical protein
VRAIDLLAENARLSRLIARERALNNLAFAVVLVAVHLAVAVVVNWK